MQSVERFRRLDRTTVAALGFGVVLLVWLGPSLCEMAYAAFTKIIDGVGFVQFG